jgi:hypothetical protein
MIETTLPESKPAAQNAPQPAFDFLHYLTMIEANARNGRETYASICQLEVTMGNLSALVPANTPPGTPSQRDQAQNQLARFNHSFTRQLDGLFASTQELHALLTGLRVAAESAAPSTPPVPQGLHLAT